MKKIIAVICLIAQIISPLAYPSVDSRNVEIYDLTDDKVIYEVGAEKVVSIASLTKIATTITAIETIEDLDQTVTVTSAMLRTVRWDLMKAGLKAGNKVSYRDLLYASMLPSGADATHVIAIASSGSIDAYVEKMNALAQKLGLSNTHFVNVTGLDANGHHSTADEVRKLLQYALQDPLFRVVFTTKTYTLSTGLTVDATLLHYNTSGVDISSILGSKTGYTGKAGYCLASLVDVNGHEMLVITLGAKKSGNVFYHVVDSVALIDFIKANYSERIIVEPGMLIKELPVYLSETESVSLYTDKQLSKYLPGDYDPADVRIVYEGAEELSYKNKPGDLIGSATYYYKDEQLHRQEFRLDAELKLSISKFAEKYKKQIILLAAAVVLVIVFIAVLAARSAKRKRARRRAQ